VGRLHVPAAYVFWRVHVLNARAVTTLPPFCSATLPETPQNIAHPPTHPLPPPHTPPRKPNLGQSPEGRQAIAEAFDAYVQALEPLYDQYGAFPHWAKVKNKEKNRVSSCRVVSCRVPCLGNEKGPRPGV
jgi:alkanesulfonate monooxygenase SsuD/methylene tetrahydromethanopterin reductase-like flavin-dependent oxidoreductase (luciferase family)